jgi:hypothetical protein
MPGISAVSPPASAAPAWRQPSAMPLHDFGGFFGVQFAGGVIVQEHERLGALGREIVHAHGDEIDADRLVAPAFDGDLELGADAVGGGQEDRILEASGLGSKTAANPPRAASAPGRAVDFAAGLIRSTRRSPSSISTPASR